MRLWFSFLRMARYYGLDFFDQLARILVLVFCGSMALAAHLWITYGGWHATLRWVSCFGLARYFRLGLSRKVARLLFVVY
jgi:hypothetical protein